MRARYRKFSYITDIPGIKTSICDKLGIGFPKQPKLNKDDLLKTKEETYDEAWFVRTIKEKVANHPTNKLEFPFNGEYIFDEPLVGFVRGDDPLFQEYKRIIALIT